MTETNGRLEATDILSPRDALLAAAHAAQAAAGLVASVPGSGGVASDMIGAAAHLAQVAHGLSVYAATVGRWAAR